MPPNHTLGKCESRTSHPQCPDQCPSRAATLPPSQHTPNHGHGESCWAWGPQTEQNQIFPLSGNPFQATRPKRDLQTGAVLGPPCSLETPSMSRKERKVSSVEATTSVGSAGPMLAGQGHGSAVRPHVPRMFSSGRSWPTQDWLPLPRELGTPPPPHSPTNAP